MDIRVTKVVEWDMGHRVPNHKNKCRHPHGHRYRLELTIAGPMVLTSGESDEGMVMDFGDIKKMMTEHVHDKLDHGFMYHTGDKRMREFFEENTDFLSIPVEFIPTAENLAAWIYFALLPHIKDPLRMSRVRLYETPNSYADYNMGIADGH